MEYANLTDIQQLFRQLTQAETERATALIPVVCAALRAEAAKVGKDLDEIVSTNQDMAIVAKSVTVDVVARTLMTSTNQEPMTQFSENASLSQRRGTQAGFIRSAHSRHSGGGLSGTGATVTI